MSPRRRTVSMVLILVAVVVGITLIKQGLERRPVRLVPMVQNKFDHNAESESELRTQLDEAKNQLANLRTELAQTGDGESRANDTNAKIAEVQAQLAKLDGDKGELELKSQTYQRQLDIQQYNAQMDLEQQIADLDASIASLTDQHVDETQIANLRTTREQLIHRMENLSASLSYERMASRQEAMESTTQVSSERGELESQLAELRKQAASQDQAANEDGLRNLHKQIGEQEVVVQKLEERLRTRYTR